MPSLDTLSEQALLRELGQRARAWRLARNVTQDELATQCGVSRRTVQNLEGGQSVQLSSFLRVLRALDLTHRLDDVLPEPMASPLEVFEREHAPRRQRASRAARPDGSSGWTWGDEA